MYWKIFILYIVAMRHVCTIDLWLNDYLKLHAIALFILLSIEPDHASMNTSHPSPPFLLLHNHNDHNPCS